MDNEMNEETKVIVDENGIADSGTKGKEEKKAGHKALNISVSLACSIILCLAVWWCVFHY